MDLTFEIPNCFAEVFFDAALLSSTPYILNGVPETKAHMLCDLDALYTGGVLGIVRRMIDVISSSLIFVNSRYLHVLLS